MLAVRRSLTEILLEVTDQEIQMVSQEELARYTTHQGISFHLSFKRPDGLCQDVTLYNEKLSRTDCNCDMIYCDNHRLILRLSYVYSRRTVMCKLCYISSLIRSYFRCCLLTIEYISGFSLILVLFIW